jgi:hypothetical protein
MYVRVSVAGCAVTNEHAASTTSTATITFFMLFPML